MGPGIPWQNPELQMTPAGGGQGVLFAAGAYPPRRLSLPRMFKFGDWAVKLEGEGASASAGCLARGRLLSP